MLNKLARCITKASVVKIMLVANLKGVTPQQTFPPNIAAILTIALYTDYLKHSCIKKPPFPLLLKLRLGLNLKVLVFGGIQIKKRVLTGCRLLNAVVQRTYSLLRLKLYHK